ncbi:hypothetical protein IKG73_01210 [Candidatus Saccharibacteria bacterium]|nr:hypothetical protein [Candidatus Saccharibacteria bacterium]
MSKVDAPDVEPTAASLPKKPEPLLHSRYMDFSPRRRPVKDAGAKPVNKPAATPVEKPLRPAPKQPSAVAVVAVPVRPSRDFVDGMPVAKKKVIKPVSNVPLIEPEIEEEDDGPMAEFNELGLSETEEELEEPLETPQEEFLTEEEDPEDYVETVLSQVSETRTETTVRRSPFLKNFHIEKRPLSDRAPEKEQLGSVDALTPTPHEEYSEKTFAKKADKAPDNAEVPVKTKEEKAGSRLGMVLTVLVTILLGAGVGVFVYLAFFQ